VTFFAAGDTDMPEIKPAVQHATFTIERIYPAAADRVFAALADPAKKRRWFAEGEKAQVDEYTNDFQVGGREYTRFRFGADNVCENHTLYQEIQPNRYIVLTYTMSMAGRRFSCSQATFELLPHETGTQLVFTEQAAFFEAADGPQIRKEGWSKLLDQLGTEVAL
jgi:uncharacterized protein YndB with AHSA1/START domain